jgi:hypothetical protein
LLTIGFACSKSIWVVQLWLCVGLSDRKNQDFDFMTSPHPPRLAYISFDTVPAPKGASIHITAFATALAQTYGSLKLATVASGLSASHSTDRAARIGEYIDCSGALLSATIGPMVSRTTAF